MNESDYLNRIAELPREIPPRNDPWQRIAARLDDGVAPAASQTRRRVGMFGAWPMRAAAAVAVIAVAVWLMPGPGTSTQQDVPSATAVTAVAPSPLATSEAEYQAAFREFIAVGDSREHIPARAVEVIESGWADLRQVEVALADALAQNPDDPFLNRRMLELRARQLGFLRQLAALDHSNRRLTI